MRVGSMGWIGALLLWLGTAASSHAQVVQLPTFRFFTVQTSVLVPDRGGAYLGGVSRSRYGSVSRGVPGLGTLPGAGRLFGNRGIASSQSVSGVGVTATIIDHAEWDRAVLAEAERRAAGRTVAGVDPEVARRADFLARHVATHERVSEVETPQPRAAGLSLEDIRLRNEQARRQREVQARQYWQRGRQAEESGKYGAARIYYQMAARHAESPARERILAHLERFDEAVAAADAPAGVELAAETGDRELRR